VRFVQLFHEAWDQHADLKNGLKKNCADTDRASAALVKDLKRRMRRKDRFWPGRFDLARLKAVKTVRAFDAAVTAPYFGFESAEDYYYRASALRVADRIRVPALVITAEDDPFVPPAPFRDPKVAGNPHIDLRISPHGGHCGFVAPASGSDDGYWAENEIVAFVERHVPPCGAWGRPMSPPRADTHVRPYAKQ